MSKYRDSQSLDCKVYVGELGSNASKKDLEEAFGHYGPLRSVWVARNPPGFAFVQFEDSRDAEDAVRGLDGRTVCGRRIRVEMSSGKTRKKHFNNHDDRYPKRRRGDGDQYADDGYQNKRYRRSPSPKRRASRSRSRSRGKRSESPSPGQSRRYSRSRSRSPN